MANLKSSKKDVKRIAKRTDYYKGVRSALKTYLKKARKSAEAGSADQGTVTKAIKSLDKAATAGIIHKNQAARRKSRLMKAIHASKKS